MTPGLPKHLPGFNVLRAGDGSRSGGGAELHPAINTGKKRLDFGLTSGIIPPGMAKQSRCSGGGKSSGNGALRADLLELVQNHCPFDKSNPCDCPLSRVRELNPKDRVQWFKALSEEDLAYLASYHQVCLAIKVDH